ncbi:MAG: DUF2207 domain-containing protein [Candidatus Berkelbacteria bacterium]|nr:DUF2207 domain-containing protein [Candidatus Berkelbacteria bacterium]
MKKIIYILFLLCTVSLIPNHSFARDNVDYWYVKDFKTQIIVNRDSSLDITENITADCGSAQKHGIFRVLPTRQILSSTKNIESPIELISITDFNNNKIDYISSNDRISHTLTWKIGNENKLVSGVNYYKIKYHVKNAVRHNSSDFDELYWNLNGNFWDIPIDNFSASIAFPEEINKDNSQTNIYSGSFSANNGLNVMGNFENNSTLKVDYSKTLEMGEGITVSVTFPKNVINPYVPTFWEKYGPYFSFLITILVLYFCIKLWKKFGQDPKINPTIAPEFEIPEKLSPIEMGFVYTDGILKNNFISASIINLAVNKFLKIKKIEGKGIFKKDDYGLTMLSKKSVSSKSEQELLEALFESGDQIKLSDLKDKFYTNIPLISDTAKNFLISKKFLVSSSRTWQISFFSVAFLVAVGGVLSLIFLNLQLGLALLLSGLIIFIFSFFMTRRTEEGAELLRKINGFKLYMETAEKYRQRFNEKENIFEKFLPYAILFGITSLWIKKMKDIYGEKYFATYHPIWYAGANFSNFDIDSVSNEISQMSSNISSTMTSSPSSSGSGGGGFSGGGGGGGGGGGW